ncbi:MAG TPA: GTP-binding protein [Xanthobacteraceae bacterium]|nr:GTP-binding protein [Xanthobacteraceae bacterium]
MTATPVILIAGERGSGKTTLLRELLRHDDAAASLVITTEQGDGTLDHAPQIVCSAAAEPLGGCICCTRRTDIQHALADALRRRRAGAMAAFDRVIVELGGDADLAAPIQTLAVDADLARHYRIAHVCAVIDARTALDAAAAMRVVLADTVLLTHADRTAAASLDALRAAVRRLNPGAAVHAVAHGRIAPELLLEAVGDAIAADWHDSPAADERDLHGIRVFTLSPDAPFPPGAAESFLDTLTRLRGADLLRFKGLMAVAGDDAPLAVQGVHHVFVPPRRLARWPGNDRRSRLTFAVRNLPRESVGRLLAPFLDPHLFVERSTS